MGTLVEEVVAPLEATQNKEETCEPKPEPKEKSADSTPRCVTDVAVGETYESFLYLVETKTGRQFSVPATFVRRA